MSTRRIITGLLTIFLLSGYSVAQTSDTNCPCCTPEHSAFDFWIGDWVVYSKGKMAGFNKITKIENGCLIRENWKSTESAYSGTSYNFYDQVSKLWKQVWVDNQGTSLELSGQYENGVMMLTSKERIDPTGKRIINRISWTNNADKTVRQVWEQSNDGGITFNILFDGLYRRRK